MVLGAFIVTLLVGLFALRAAGSSLSGLAGLRPEASVPEPTISAPVPLVPDTNGFDAARIIDDEVFYNAGAMTHEEVAAFLTRVNAGCQPGDDGTQCLATATFSTQSREATTFCPGGIEDAAGVSAADVIWEVSQACDVNPQVLLVLIHKEQGLLTASGQTLSARDYETAAGYSCPDHGACDPQWAGFFSQLYGAASQFQRYRLNPDAYDVVAQRPAQVAYSPHAQCGGAELTAVNQATAGLYNYTPFQPNEAAEEEGTSAPRGGTGTSTATSRRSSGVRHRAHDPGSLRQSPSFLGLWRAVVLRSAGRNHIVTKRHHLDALFPGSFQTASAES